MRGRWRAWRSTSIPGFDIDDTRFFSTKNDVSDYLRQQGVPGFLIKSAVARFHVFAIPQSKVEAIELASAGELDVQPFP